ncbi:S-adenosyl-L-methionine-dependent methyltransferase [Diplogelasinospora grovesii]|uniref:S-adenosyl-L-methionine-dependent methyltransferase n=1 Tax=Diplogelasinospora grovesii TaxID=303347 RepID=A0AAN6S2G1_9PEZI|nr:S-adenosyl-L-methionine-dependent methyltransferase [Diplogelasinospora grovesii]
MESQSGAGSGVEDLPEVARVNLVTAALKLVGAVRPPSDSIMSWFANISMVSAVRLFQHWDAFNLIPYTGRHDCISYADLAAKLQAEESLLYRIASMLTSTGVLEHVAPNHLAHTPISLLLRENEPLGSMFKVMYALVLETSTILPSYFDTYGWKEPIGPTHVPSSFLEGKPELAYFDLVSQDPARMENFMCAMSVANRGRVVTTGVYPMDFVLGAAEREPDRKIWVDVGGGSGNTVKQFLLKNPRLKGSQCVVQDLPDVCEAAQQQADKTLRGVTWVPINFHKQAPIEGAMIYYIRHIARDYSDPVLTKILRNIRSAMTRPDSKVLISEQLSSTPPNVYAAFRDYSMMSIGGKERNLEQFRVVVEDAGLKVSGVFKDKQTPQAVIECSLP